MALLLHYIGTAASSTLLVAWRQNKSPEWSKHYAGEPDTCNVVWQGPQYQEKAFLDSLTKYQSLTYVDENGTTVTDTGMFLDDFSSDGAAIFPTVTLSYKGVRNGTVPDAIPTDGITSQSASTSAVITDVTSPNYGKTLTLAISYYAARTSWKWVQLSDPAGTPPSPKNTVRNHLSYTQPPSDPKIWYYRYSGMVGADGLPTHTIPTGDATFVWNTFAGATSVSGFQSEEIVPGKLWQCNSTVEFLLLGT